MCRLYFAGTWDIFKRSGTRFEYKLLQDKYGVITGEGCECGQGWSIRIEGRAHGHTARWKERIRLTSKGMASNCDQVGSHTASNFFDPADVWSGEGIYEIIISTDDNSFG